MGMTHRECPNPQPDCKYAQLKGGCFSDEHHLFYPRYEYTKPTEKLFRELPENKVQICRREHDEIHATEEPPKKPPVPVIIAALSLRNIERESA